VNQRSLAIAWPTAIRDWRQLILRVLNQKAHDVRHPWIELEALDCDLELLCCKALRSSRGSPLHFVVDERWIKIDISF
jgi:hypothetical protein